MAITSLMICLLINRVLRHCLGVPAQANLDPEKSRLRIVSDAISDNLRRSVNSDTLTAIVDMSKYDDKQIAVVFQVQHLANYVRKFQRNLILSLPIAPNRLTLALSSLNRAVVLARSYDASIRPGRRLRLYNYRLVSLPHVVPDFWPLFVQSW